MIHKDAREIETARLRLRIFRTEDADALYRIYSDSQVMRYIRNGQRTAEQVQQEIAGMMHSWEQQPWGQWAIICKENAALIGMAGFGHEADVGYILDQAYWGRGIATEALRACLRYGFEHLRLEIIGAGALRANSASLRVIEKAGLHPVPNPFFDTHGGAYFQISRDDFNPGNAAYILHPVPESHLRPQTD